MVVFFFPPLPTQNMRFFCDIPCENLVGLREVKLTKVWSLFPISHDWVPLEHWLSDLSTHASSSVSITVQVSLPWPWSPWNFLLAGVCFGKLWFSVFPCLSDFRSSGLPYDHTSLLDLRVVDFALCSAFSYCQDRMATSSFLLRVRPELQVLTFFQFNMKSLYQALKQ